MSNEVSEPVEQASSTAELSAAVVALKAQLEEQQKAQASILLQLSALQQKSLGTGKATTDSTSGKWLIPVGLVNACM